jgi:hypothetical protein
LAKEGKASEDEFGRIGIRSEGLMERKKLEFASLEISANHVFFLWKKMAEIPAGDPGAFAESAHADLGKILLGEKGEEGIDDVIFGWGIHAVGSRKRFFFPIRMTQKEAPFQRKNRFRPP